MTVISPSVVRFEQPLQDCARILNGLGCISVHVDVCHGVIFPSFFDVNEMRSGILDIFNGQVTLHIFCPRPVNEKLDLSFLRYNDIAVYHVFPDTRPRDIARFLTSTETAECRLGLSLDLKVDMSVLEEHLARLDTVFVMGIPVATHGLQAHQDMLVKLLQVRSVINRHNPPCRVGLDGGVNATTFPILVTLVDELVVGSLLLNSDDLLSQWKALNSTTRKMR